MDFSAKKLKENLAEKQRLARVEEAARELLRAKEVVKSKELKAFIELNKPHLFKSALNKRKGVQLLTPRYYESWWNNAEFTEFLLDRGFEIVDFDSDYFGVWFGEIHQLDFDDLQTLEESLLESYEDVKRIASSINNKQLKEIIRSYKSNNVSQINVLRLLVVFHKIVKLNYFVDEDDEIGLDVPEINLILSTVEENVSVFLPNNFNRLIVGMEDQKEFFTISWRIPYESIPESDGLTAENLNWLSSKQGNESFLKIYELIKECVESSKASIELKIQVNKSKYLTFTDQKLAGLIFEMSIEDLKCLLEVLDFAVSIVSEKDDYSILKISWE